VVQELSSLRDFYGHRWLISNLLNVSVSFALGAIGYWLDLWGKVRIDPRAVAVSRYGWLKTSYGWLAG